MKEKIMTRVKIGIRKDLADELSKMTIKTGKSYSHMISALLDIAEELPDLKKRVIFLESLVDIKECDACGEIVANGEKCETCDAMNTLKRGYGPVYGVCELCRHNKEHKFCQSKCRVKDLKLKWNPVDGVPTNALRVPESNTGNGGARSSTWDLVLDEISQMFGTGWFTLHDYTGKTKIYPPKKYAAAVQMVSSNLCKRRGLLHSELRSGRSGSYRVYRVKGDQNVD
jgi:hypothetical protein